MVLKFWPFLHFAWSVGALVDLQELLFFRNMSPEPGVWPSRAERLLGSCPVLLLFFAVPTFILVAVLSSPVRVPLKFQAQKLEGFVLF